MEDKLPIDTLEYIIDKFNMARSCDPDHCIHKAIYYRDAGESLSCWECVIKSCPFNSRNLHAVL